MTWSLDELAADRASAAALQHVLSVAEAGDGTVRWREVSGELTDEQWGRLLASGLLVPVDGGVFVVDDPTAVRTALDDARVPPDNSSPDGSQHEWTTADRAAGVVAIGLLSGYQVSFVRDAIAGLVDLALGPVATLAPFPVLVLTLALVTTVGTTVVRRRLRPDDGLSEVRERLQRVRERLDAARERGDEDAIERFEAEQRDLVGEQFGAMKGMVRPLVWTMLFTVPVFIWLSWLVVAPSQAVVPAASFIPVLGRVYWTARVLGPVQAWMLWYAICSLTTGIVVRRTADRVGVPA